MIDLLGNRTSILGYFGYLMCVSVTVLSHHVILDIKIPGFQVRHYLDTFLDILPGFFMDHRILDKLYFIEYLVAISMNLNNAY